MLLHDRLLSSQAFRTGTCRTLPRTVVSQHRLPTTSNHDPGHTTASPWTHARPFRRPIKPMPTCAHKSTTTRATSQLNPWMSHDQRQGTPMRSRATNPFIATHRMRPTFDPTDPHIAAPVRRLIMLSRAQNLDRATPDSTSPCTGETSDPARRPTSSHVLFGTKHAISQLNAPPDGMIDHLCQHIARGNRQIDSLPCPTSIATTHRKTCKAARLRSTGHLSAPDYPKSGLHKSHRLSAARRFQPLRRCHPCLGNSERLLMSPHLSIRPRRWKPTTHATPRLDSTTRLSALNRNAQSAMHLDDPTHHTRAHHVSADYSRQAATMPAVRQVNTCLSTPNHVTVPITDDPSMSLRLRATHRNRSKNPIRITAHRLSWPSTHNSDYPCHVKTFRAKRLHRACPEQSGRAREGSSSMGNEFEPGFATDEAFIGYVPEKMRNAGFVEVTNAEDLEPYEPSDAEIDAGVAAMWGNSFNDQREIVRLILKAADSARSEK